MSETNKKDETIIPGIKNQEDKSIIFYVKDKELLKITLEGFFYKDQRVDDIHNIYERFNEWMAKSEMSLI